MTSPEPDDPDDWVNPLERRNIDRGMRATGVRTIHVLDQLCGHSTEFLVPTDLRVAIAEMLMRKPCPWCSLRQQYGEVPEDMLDLVGAPWGQGVALMRPALCNRAEFLELCEIERAVLKDGRPSV